MNVLSLFNGMSFGMMALESLNVPVTNYYSSEIDKYANQATKALFPDVIQLGDVTKWQEWDDIDWGKFDLLLAGFPCQAWSMAGKQKGDKDPRGALVHDLISIWQKINYHRKAQGKNPVKFMFENVKMKKEFLDYINELFGVEPICINSALVSAQNRVRYYWTNIDGVDHPEDKGILLKDVVEPIVDDKYTLSNKLLAGFERKRIRRAHMKSGFDKLNIRELDQKSSCLTARYYKTAMSDPYVKCGSMIGRKINPTTGKRDDYNPDIKTVQRIEIRSDEKTGTITTVQKDNLVVTKDKYRKLTPTECFRLQTVPEHHIDTLLNSGISNTQLYKMCGNGWTHDVIVHIFKGLTTNTAS